MKRAITTSLLVFWATQFALQAVAALKGMPLALLSPFEVEAFAVSAPQQSMPISLLAVACGLLSALFAWAAFCAIAGRAEPGESGEETAKLAFSVAVFSVAALTVLSALRGIYVPLHSVSVLVAALAVSWTATQHDAAALEAGADTAGQDSRRVARHMAGEVAHKTMLGAISGRAGSKRGAD